MFWQREIEGRAGAGLAVHADVAAVAAHDLPADEQAQPEAFTRAVLAGRVIDLREPAEDALMLRGVDAPARVGDRHADELRIGGEHPGAHGNGAAGVREL